MGDHPLSHPNAGNFFGKTYRTTRGTPLPSAGELLLIAGGQRSPNWCSSWQHTTKAFITAETTTLMSAHKRRGDHRTKRFTRFAWKEEERAVQEILFYKTISGKSLNIQIPIMLQRYLYPIYKPPPALTCEARRHLCAHSPPAHDWLAGWLAGWLACSGTAATTEVGLYVLLPCSAPLAPSGVQSTTRQLLLSALLGWLCFSPPRLLVLSCLAPLWFSHALWSCPAWFFLDLPRPLVLSCLAPHWCSLRSSAPLHAGPAIFIV